MLTPHEQKLRDKAAPTVRRRFSRDIESRRRVRDAMDKVRRRRMERNLDFHRRLYGPR